jgi:hypothetical protein
MVLFSPSDLSSSFVSHNVRTEFTTHTTNASTTHTERNGAHQDRMDTALPPGLTALVCRLPGRRTQVA